MTKETLWLTQALMSELFQVSVPTINEHLKGLYADKELAEAATIRKFRIVRLEGQREVSRKSGHNPFISKYRLCEQSEAIHG